MSTTRLILSEIRFRSVNFLLCLAAVVIAATLFITGPTLLGAPLITVLASYIPARTAVAQDPAIVLMDT